MDKQSYLLAAIKSNCHLLKKWTLEAFATVNRQTLGDYGKAPYPYQIFLIEYDKPETGYYDPISGGVVPFSEQNEPPLSFKDRIKLVSGDLPNVKKDIDTNMGNVFVNAVILCHPFGGKVDFITGYIDPQSIEKKIVPRIVPNPPEGEVLATDDITIKELIAYQESLMYCDQFASLCAPSQSKKMHVQNKKIRLLRDKLVKEKGDTINDLTVLADVEAQLVALDREELKGDPAELAIRSSKVWTVCRKKKYAIYGLEQGFGVKTIITSALCEGLDPEMLPAYANSARSGSYNRGAQTAFGGVECKRANRAFKAVNIIEDDCGSKLGIPVVYDGGSDLVGRWMLDPATKKPIQLTDELLKGQKGSVIYIRTPLLCKTEGLHYCKTCCGARLSMMPNGIHIQVSTIGSVLMNCFMKAMHGKSLSTAHYDYRLRIS